MTMDAHSLRSILICIRVNGELSVRKFIEGKKKYVSFVPEPEFTYF